MCLWLLLKLPDMSITYSQKKVCYKNANVQFVPSGTGEGKLDATAVLEDTLHLRGRCKARLVCTLRVPGVCLWTPISSQIQLC